MTISVRIGSQEREVDSVSESWISEQVERRRRDGSDICLQVIINIGSINMVLSTAGCRGGDGGGRRPNDRERGIFDLWTARRLDKSDFQVGNVIAFLHKLRRVV